MASLHRNLKTLSRIQRGVNSKHKFAPFMPPSFSSAATTTNTAEPDWTDCWKCNSKHQSELFCPSCSTVQCLNCTANKLNYFQLFKGQPSFEVDLSTLKPYYIKLQSMLHPDRFVNSTEREQDYSTTQSALVNEAYKTMQDPLKRGLYLLEIHGHKIDSEIVESDSNNLLGEIFALNFEVDECECSDELRDILRNVNADIKQEIEEISKCFQEQNFLNAKDALMKLRYRENIKNKIEEKIFKLEL